MIIIKDVKKQNINNNDSCYGLKLSAQNDLKQNIEFFNERHVGWNNYFL